MVRRGIRFGVRVRVRIVLSGEGSGSDPGWGFRVGRGVRVLLLRRIASDVRGGGRAERGAVEGAGFGFGSGFGFGVGLGLGLALGFG